ncbi:MAG TPA: site-2 protease family protein [Candidatus Paceibacterota bacterium]|nr:site-2 protease family protein [Candidatus Paceibacterota bacterium]HMO83231.1 site-2 protease family protein [Candidatus Paceibacterota bacterium]
MSILIFLLVLFVLILVHEWGHYIAAKKTGMRVDEFAIGFPPKLFSVKKGETEYSFNALPIGGFVRIFGESLEGVDASDSDKARAFTARPLWAQAVVLIAGVTMNVVLAWFLFVFTFMIGVPTAVEESVASPDAVLYVSGLLPGGPLADKLPVGSEIVSLRSGEVLLVDPSPTSFSEFVQSYPASEIEITYRQKEAENTVTVTPEAGLIPDQPTRAAVGVSLALVESESLSFGASLKEATFATYNGLINITVGLTGLLVETFKGTADFSQVAGPIGIVGMVGEAANFGLTALLTFTAIISLNLAVINMLPIPALDGGRLLFVAYEAVTGKAVNPVWSGRLNLIGFVFLMLLMIAVTYNDIVRLFT